MANNFRFRLASVLKLRERDRDEAAESLRQAMQARQILLDQIAEVQAERTQQNRLRIANNQEAIDPQRFLDAQRYQMYLDSRVAGLQGQVGLIDQEIERRRAALVKCEQAVRSLEKLQDHQRSEWMAAEAARAQSRLDQWSSFRYWSNSE